MTNPHTQALLRRSTRSRGLALACAAAALALIAGCASQAPSGPSAPPASGPTAPTSASKSPSPKGGDTPAAIGVLTQSHDGDDIVEILHLVGGTANPAVGAVNTLIDNDLVRPYQAFLASRDDAAWVEIRSYPFTSDRYLQIVTTVGSFPAYADVGQIYAYVYDRQADAVVTVEDAVTLAGTDQDSILAGVSDAFVPEVDSQWIEQAEVRGFRFVEGPNGPVPLFLLTITLASQDTEPETAFFSYLSPGPGGSAGELLRLNPLTLFDPTEMDPMNPPLSYGRGGSDGDWSDPGDGQGLGDSLPPETAGSDPGDTASDGGAQLLIEPPPGESIKQTGGGFDPEGKVWASYSGLDGLIAMSIHQAATVAASDAAGKREQILGAALDADADSFTITPNAEASAAYTYPVNTFEFDATVDGVTNHHLGLYFETDSGGFVVDMAAAIADWPEASVAINNWLKHLQLTDPPA